MNSKQARFVGEYIYVEKNKQKLSVLITKAKLDIAKLEPYRKID